MSEQEQDSLILDLETGNLGDVDNFDPVPAGRYPIAIAKVEVKKTKDEKGKYLSVTSTVIDGAFKGRKIFARFNIFNASEKAQEIGRKQLGNLLKATGLVGENDMAKLVGKECEVSVRVRPAENDYPASNEVNRYDPFGGAKTSSTSTPATPDATEKPAAKKPAFMGRR